MSYQELYNTRMADPAFSLLAYGMVQDQRTSQMIQYDPYAVTKSMQSTLLAYYSQPPKLDDGMNVFLNVLASRQSGKSTVVEMIAYPKVAYTPGLDHLTIADTRDRGDYLHGRTQLTHMHWPEALRVPTLAHNETRKISFVHGGKMRIISGKAESAGIGQSPDSLHGSELPFWEDAAAQWALINPSIINRENALVINESTPAPDSAPSALWWREQYELGYTGASRWRSLFFPFWDSKLCERAWKDTDVLTLEEQRRLDRYGPYGLGLRNLSFRRFVMESDPTFKRNPALFDVFYPSDDVSCWGAVEELHIREEHFSKRDHEFEPNNGQAYQRFREPKPGAVYLVSVDPSGYGRDHSAFVCTEVYRDHREVVSTFGDNIEPHEFNERVLAEAELYNRAYVAVERNGVGLGCIAHLQAREYPRIVHYWRDGKPGIPKLTHDQVITAVMDELLNTMVLRSTKLKRQCLTYRGDIAIQQSTNAAIAGVRGRGRARHHWDLFSALAIGCLAFDYIPTKHRPNEHTETHERKVLDPQRMSYDDWEQLRAAASALKQQPAKRYVPRGRR